MVAHDTRLHHKSSEGKWRTYLYVHAPPATVFMQDPQCQMPTALLFIFVWKLRFSICETTRWSPSTSGLNVTLQSFLQLRGPRDCSNTHLATEGAGVFSMLRDFYFLHHLPQRRAITRAIFTNNPHLLGSLGLKTAGNNMNEQTFTATLRLHPAVLSLYFRYSEHSLSTDLSCKPVPVVLLHLKTALLRQDVSSTETSSPPNMLNNFSSV